MFAELRLLPLVGGDERIACASTAAMRKALEQPAPRAGMFPQCGTTNEGDKGIPCGNMPVPGYCFISCGCGCRNGHLFISLAFRRTSISRRGASRWCPRSNRDNSNLIDLWSTVQ